ncbi:MAG: uroporphyrinogen decarboxylase [Vampirovibrio sp.]|nr:uroporphyrinogen decarboxylase [Vampirovibrio sp.]
MADISTPDTQAPLLVRACRGQTLSRPPVWLMRQAGRYMQAYQDMRAKYSFLELCKNTDAAVEVSLQPYKAFSTDAVIMFSDILIPPEAMGMELTFTEKGPTLPNPIRSASDIDRLIIPDPVEKTGFVMNLLNSLRQELAGDSQTALIGFAGAPWTLASYMVEGGVSKNYTHMKTMLYNDPTAFHRLLDKLAQTIILYLNAQIEAGAQVVQLFDSWGGIVSKELYREFILPYHQQVISGLNRQDVPVILYVNGSAHVLEMMAEAQPDVISVDHLTSLTEARRRVGDRFTLQGNLDPTALFAKPEVLKPMVDTLLKEGGTTGYIFNLGHGVLPKTPVENVKLVIDTVKNYSCEDSFVSVVHPAVCT